MSLLVQPLTCHPSTPCDAIERITASVERDPDGWLRLRYVVEGDRGYIALPAAAAAQHTDGLWRHTCFEAFITAEDAPAYVECNFSPSGAWATYRFNRYRSGMAPIAPAQLSNSPPRVSLDTKCDRLVLEARLRLVEFACQPIRIGLTAVIEDQADKFSYWALRHPRAKPDFHHRGGFILRLVSPSA